MKRYVCLLTALCLVASMFPLTGNASPLESASLSPQAGSAAVSGVRDVEQVLSQTVATSARSVPAATDFRAQFGVTGGYPAYNGNYDNAVSAAGGDVEAQKAAVLAENEAILDYDALDASGNLYKNGQPKGASADGKTVTRLVRHTAGVSNYGDSIPDSTESVTKRLSLRMVRYGNVVTGLYAPPGEVVKVTLKSTSADKSPQDLGLKAYIGNFSGNTAYSDVPSTRNFVRMPRMNKILALDQATTYIGSPLGGAILVYSSGIGGATVEMEIEGAVEMPTYFYGTTTHAELVEQLHAPAPYFAFSTPRGVRVTGPISLVKNMVSEYGYEKAAAKIERAMEFWDKAFGVSYQFTPNGYCNMADPDTNLLVETFDPHIPAGSAVNLGWYSICPVGWGAWHLDGDYLVSSGAWGNIHELNHSFRWGGAVDACVEIENNVISALTYQLYSNIAASRTEAGGLPSSSGWNWCADAYYTMERIRANNAAGAKTDNLEVYVPVQHAFGADTFIAAVNAYKDAGGKEGRLSNNPRVTNSNVWMYATSLACGYDMGYYMRDVLLFPEKASEDAGATDYLTSAVMGESRAGREVYIPSGCLYASGFVYGAGTSGERVVEMDRPFRIPYGASKILNFNSSDNGGFVSVGNGETVELVGYTRPQHGTIATMNDRLKLTYTPDKNYLDDYFYITLKLTVNDPASSYNGLSQEVTYKVALQQDTSVSGFTTTFYDYPNTYPAASPSTAVASAAAACVGKLDPSSMAMASIAGFNGSGQEKAGRFAVVEGELYLPRAGDVDLYVRGNVYYNTCVAASASALPAAADAQSKLTGNIGTAYNRNNGNSHLRVHVVPEGGSAPSDAGAYAAVVNEGEPLYVRAYVLMPAQCTCNYRIGYLDGGTVKEFDAGMLSKQGSGGGLVTPAIADLETDKLYSYTDPAIQSTALYDFTLAGEPLVPVGAWDLTEDANHGKPLATYGSNPLGNSVDDDLSTMFHGRVANGSYYQADFVYELSGSAQPFNTIRYKGHANNEHRGKVKDYEVYVGDDLEVLKAADTGSPSFVCSGTARQGYDTGVYNLIEFPKAVTGKYVRLVARSAYPSNGQYYYAFSDFKLGFLSGIDGEGRVVEGFSTAGSWEDDTTFVNTRSVPRKTSSGTGSFTFTGQGVILYSITGPSYGNMSVRVDGDEPTIVSLTSPNVRGQQPVFWKAGFGEGQHTVTFGPAIAGADTVNVEYFEVKASAGDAPVAAPEDAELSIQLNQTRFYYTGQAIEPEVSVLLDGADVTADCAISYANNVAPGRGTASVTARFDDGTQAGKTASATFDIVMATYDKTVTASFADGATEIRHGDASAPRPQVQGAPEGATATFYYCAQYDGFDASSAEGTAWDAGAMKPTTLAAGDYYLWAVVSSPTYADVVTEPFPFKVVHEHVWGAPVYEWADDNSKVTARATCAIDAAHAVSKTVATTYAVTVEPIASRAGEGAFTAAFADAPFTTQVKSVAIPALAGRALAVSLDAGGGAVDPAGITVHEGSAYGELPTPERQAWIFDGWFTSAEGGSRVTAATTVTASQDHVLHARWLPTAEVTGRVVSGTVSSPGGTVENARVELRRGNAAVGIAVTDGEGAFKVTGVPFGTYNVVVTATVEGSDRVVTQVRDVGDFDVDAGDIVIPGIAADSRLVVEGDLPVVAGGLDTLAESELAAAQAGGNVSVSVTMTVAESDEASADGGVEIRGAVEAVAGEKDAEVAYYDISLARQTRVDGVSPGAAESITSARCPLLIALPYAFDDADAGNIVVYRYHGGQVEVLDRVYSKALAPDQSLDGKFFLDESSKLVCVYASEFSTYAVGYLFESGSSEVDPGTNPGTNTGTDPGTKPGEGTGSNPGTKPDEGKGETPGENTGETPGDEPGDEPGTTPGETPGANPGETPGGQQGDVPEAGDPGKPPQAEPVAPGDLLGSGDATYRIVSVGAAIAAYHKAPASAASVSIPSKVNLGGKVFRVDRIDRSAFTGSKVKSVMMASSVKRIDQRAFYKASRLASVVVGDGVMVVSKQAFAQCPRLNSVTLGKSVVTLGQSAFSGDKKLKKLTVKTRHLTKRTAAKSLSGSKVVSVKVKVSGATMRKRCVKAYRPIFSKRNAGRAAKVT